METKRKLLLCILVMMGINFFAQDNSGGGGSRNLQLGLKAGLNQSNVYDVQTQDFVASPKLGFAAGGFICLPLGSFIGIQPEVMYSQKGFTATGKMGGDFYTFTRTTDYMDVPIQLQLKPVRMISFVFGPEFSYLTKRTDVFQSKNFTDVQEQQFVNDNLRKNTMGFIGGADINFLGLMISGRVGWDLQINNGDGSTTLPRYKNVWVQGTVGFKL